MNVAIILAGGRGERFGAALPKQFAQVLGKPVLAYTLEVFQQSPDIDAIEVVCQDEFADRVTDIARDYGISKLLRLAPAGDSCPMSIRNGVLALRDVLSDDGCLVLHMGISPLVSREDIAQAVRVCREKGCCFTMHPVYVCLARRDGEGWTETDAPKENFIELNTPWAFRYGDVYDLYRRLDERGQALAVNDYTLSLWLADGRRAWYVRGNEAGRLKITTTYDRDLFEGCLLVREKQHAEAAKNAGGECK